MLGRLFHYCLAGIRHYSFTAVALWGPVEQINFHCRIKVKKPERHIPGPCLCEKAEVKRED